MPRSNFLSDQQSAQRFIEGIRALKDPARSPWPNQPGLSVYDALVFWHHQTMMLMTPPGQNDRNAAHSGPAFLPWHRYFLLTTERLLQQVLGRPAFRLPYWNWAFDAELAQPANSPIWSMANLGQFVAANWEVRLAMNPINGAMQRVSRQLRRTVGAKGRLPRQDEVRVVVRNQAVYDVAPFNSSSPSGLRNPLEGWLGAARIHNNVHVWVGGDMELSSSPNDPTFFLHHGNIDRIWAGWQQKHAAAPYVPDAGASADLQFHRIDDPLYSLFEEQVTPRQMLDYKASYEYDALDDVVGP